MASTRDIRDLAKDALATVDGLTSSGLIFINRQQVATTMHRSFTVNVEQSRNTNKYRDRDRMRLGHTITVELVHVVKPKDQEDSLDTAFDDEDAAINAMMTHIPLEMEARILYASTRRALSHTGDYIFSTLTFDSESDRGIF